MRFLLLAGLMVLPVVARAQERPQTLPTRDVDITYRILRGGQTLQERTRWLVSQAVQRIDPPGTAMYMLMDHRTHHAAMVDDAHRTVLDMATAAAAGPLDPGSSARFVRRDAAVVAGLPCTDWQSDAGGADAVLCIKSDGALLRVQSHGQTLVEAVAVSYTPADPAAFAVPEGYRHVSPPK
jgi:hypothetical protein